MSRYRNTSDETVYFRDDAPEKHAIAPGDSFDVVGDQHRELVESLPGVELAPISELRADAEAAGIVDLPKRARKAEIVDALDSAATGPNPAGATS